MDTLDDLLNDINAITSELGLANKPQAASPAKSNDRASAESGFRGDSPKLYKIFLGYKKS